MRQTKTPPETFHVVHILVGHVNPPLLPTPSGAIGETFAAEDNTRLTRRALIPEQWIEEATEKCPSVPIILVGLKKDLREDPVASEEMRKKSLRFVTEHDGEAVAREIGAKKYLECSSLSGDGVDDVFEAATRAALLTFEKGEGGGCCVIL